MSATQKCAARWQNCSLFFTLHVLRPWRNSCRYVPQLFRRQKLTSQLNCMKLSGVGMVFFPIGGFVFSFRWAEFVQVWYWLVWHEIVSLAWCLVAVSFLIGGFAPFESCSIPCWSEETFNQSNEMKQDWKLYLFCQGGKTPTHFLNLTKEDDNFLMWFCCKMGMSLPW